MSTQTKYIIDKNEPFKGHVTSSMSVYPYVDYSGQLYNSDGSVTGKPNENLTFNQYITLDRNSDKQLKIISDTELDVLLKEYTDTLITDISQISEDDYCYFLEVLPPVNWHKVMTGVTAFYVSERLYGDIVGWYVAAGDYYYTFRDQSTVSDSDIKKRLINLTTHDHIESKYA